MVWGEERIKGNCFRVFEHLEHSVIYDCLRKDKWLFMRTPAVKVDNLFHRSVPSLLLNVSNAFTMNDAPLDRNCNLGDGFIYILQSLGRERWVCKIIPFLIQRSGSIENGVHFFFFFPPFHPVFLTPSMSFSDFLCSLPLFPLLCPPLGSHLKLYFLFIYPFLFFLLPKYSLSLK